MLETEDVEQLAGCEQDPLCLVAKDIIQDGQTPYTVNPSISMEWRQFECENPDHNTFLLESPNELLLKAFVL